ncbi:MAG: hypothetical protein JWM27_4913 [Gemmatimonadetes bacterium]|nr:hypothetical protein [Gemmatimonadota bacterium]
MLALLSAAAVLGAAAAPAAGAASPAPTAAASAVPSAAGPRRPLGALPAAQPLDHAPSPPAPAPDAGVLLRDAQARVRRGHEDPATEVDRWAVHLATDPESGTALRRYARYRALIEGALAARGLPRDLAFLPWVESEWKNEATSRAGAAGMWQLMPATARAYGLEVSAYVDERRDPVRATNAAARHLSDLYRETHDWHTALAAYNAGVGRTGRARGAFWSRRWTLPAETRAYVPHVLAAARVGRAPRGWGLDAGETLPLRFREVWVPGGIALDSVAHRLGADPSALRDLNPHLTRGITPPGRRWPVRVPAQPSPPSRTLLPAPAP